MNQIEAASPNKKKEKKKSRPLLVRKGGEMVYTWTENLSRTADSLIISDGWLRSIIRHEMTNFPFFNHHLPFSNFQPNTNGSEAQHQADKSTP